MATRPGASRRPAGTTRLVAACWLIQAWLPGTALADNDADSYFTPSVAVSAADSATDREPTLPSELTPVPQFDQMVPVDTDRLNGQRFAVDMSSLRVVDRSVMMALSARSKSGVITTGYYAFRCNLGTYRLMAYPAGGAWKPSSVSSKWREVFSQRRRAKPFPIVFNAACKLDKTPVSGTEEFRQRVASGRNLSPN